MKLFILILFMLLSGMCYAQFQGKLIYTLTTRGDTISTFPGTTGRQEVAFNGDLAIELPSTKFYKNNMEKQVRATGDNSYEMREVVIVKSKGKPIFVFRNFKTGLSSQGDNVKFNVYLIEEKIEQLKWDIAAERRQINNIECTKATTSFRGRKYEAWFAESIPVSIGPWKFFGLPGLIVKINDTNNLFTWQLESYDFTTKVPDDIFKIPLPFKNDTAITHKKFMEMNKHEEEVVAMQSRSSTTKNYTSTIRLGQLKELF